MHVSSFLNLLCLQPPFAGGPRCATVSQENNFVFVLSIIWNLLPDSPVSKYTFNDKNDLSSVNIRRSLEEYLKLHALADTINNIQKLQSECGIKLIMTGKEDPDELECFVQYRVAFYVAGGESALQNFFCFLDGYLQFKSKQFARANPFEVKIHPHDLI